MEKDVIFDEFAQREVLAEIRLVLEDTVGILEREKQPCQGLVRLAKTVARAYEYHELLLGQMVIQETMEGSARMVNKDLLLRIEALERELIYTRGMLAQECNTAKKLFEVVFEGPNSIRLGGLTSS